MFRKAHVERGFLLDGKIMRISEIRLRIKTGKVIFRDFDASGVAFVAEVDGTTWH